MNQINTYNKILYIQWHITNNCEENCKHCYNTSNINNTDLSLNENLAIIDRIIEYSKLIKKDIYIAFTGGDPLLYPYFNAVSYTHLEDIFFVSIPNTPPSFFKRAPHWLKISFECTSFS